jgi:hypothetical protein
MKKVLKIVVVILFWIDDHINHAIIEEILNHFSDENKIVYFLEDRCYHFCQWVSELSYDNFPEDWKPVEPEE